MRPRRLSAVVRGAAVAGTCALASAMPASAQCAMCGLSASNSPVRAFLQGVVVLLVPVTGILIGMAVLTWKARDWDGRNGPHR